MNEKSTSFVSIITDEFHPELNDEHVGYAWVDIGAWPRPLHAGTRLILQNKNNIKKLNLIQQVIENILFFLRKPKGAASYFLL